MYESKFRESRFVFELVDRDYNFIKNDLKKIKHKVDILFGDYHIIVDKKDAYKIGLLLDKYDIDAMAEYPV